LGLNLDRLKDFFRPDEIEFRIGATNHDKTKGIALAYVTNRAIQNRLDEVCGPENWRNEYKPWKENSQICGISIYDTEKGEWITKWDGAEDTKTEPVKGGLSGAMKRAAVQWGIGRYLYDIPNVWVEIVPVGKSYKFKNTPTLPPEFLPAGAKNEGYLADVATDEDEALNEMLTNSNATITDSQKNLLSEIILVNHIDVEKIKKHYKIKSLDVMTQSQFTSYIELLQEKMPGFKLPKAKPTLNVKKEKEQLDEINQLLGGGAK
jgi:hypothetical protein